MNTLKWYLVDNALTASAVVEEVELKAQTKEGAIAEATDKWEHLSTYDQKHRDEFYVCRATVDDDGCFDYDTVTDVYRIK